MSAYAYRDSKREHLVRASELELSKDGKLKSGMFFCGSPFCKAEMLFQRRTERKRAHFRASRTHGHSPGCIYKAIAAYQPEDYDEEHFSFRDLMQYLAGGKPAETDSGSGGGGGSEEPKARLMSLRDVYMMLKHYDPSMHINGRKVGDMLVDERNIAWYKDGVSGQRIIEGRLKGGYFYERDKLEIHLTVGTTSGLQLTVEFTDSTYFDATIKKLFGKDPIKKDSEGDTTSGEVEEKPRSRWRVVVGGDWSLPEGGARYRAQLNSKRQLFMFEIE